MGRRNKSGDDSKHYGSARRITSENCFGTSQDLRRRCLYRQGMHTLAEFFRQRRIHHAVLLDAALAAEGFGHDLNPKMTLSNGTRAGMAGMLIRFVDHFQRLGRESLPEL